MSTEKSILDYVPSETSEQYWRNLVNKNRILESKGLPSEIPYNAVLSIVDVDVTYLTHGLHAFPAKFIPQVPRWAILKFSAPGEIVLDPFVGSGTTSVEAELLGRNSYGIDVDPLARYIAKVKTTPLDIQNLKTKSKWLLERIRGDTGLDYQPPRLKNIDHWFKPYVQRDLSIIKKRILKIEETDMRDFFMVCFSSIVKNVSNADPQFLFSVQYSKKMRELDRRGRVVNTIQQFEDTLKIQVPRIIKFSEKCPRNVFARILDVDARETGLPDKSVDLVVTSPPYINAMDYLRSHRLEMYWVDLLHDEENKIELQRKFIGTERVYANEYNKLHSFGHSELDSILDEIFRKDKKRSYITYKFFADMKLNFEEIWRVLKPNGVYVLVIGDGVIRKVPVPTHKLLQDISQEVGFKVENRFSYVLKNRFMRIDRKGEGGLIECDWVTVFRKVRAHA